MVLGDLLCNRIEYFLQIGLAGQQLVLLTSLALGVRIGGGNDSGDRVRPRLTFVVQVRRAYAGLVSVKMAVRFRNLLRWNNVVLRIHTNAFNFKLI